MAKKLWSFGIIVFVGGLVVGYLLSFRPQEPVLAPAEDLSPVKVKLQSILDHEYADYQRLKTLEERYSKADEILSKIMTIFLADLQLHILAPKVEETSGAKDGSELAKNSASPTSTPADAAATSSVGKAVSKKGMEVFPALSSLVDREQIDQFLNSQKKDDLRSTWSEADSITVLPPNMNGCFEGSVQVEEPSEVWPVTMLYKFGNGKRGESLITLSSDGKVFSRTSGNGNLNNLRGIPNDNQTFLMEAAPDIIFQMYYLPTQESWVGNIYKKSKNDVFKFKGKLSLHRGIRCE